MREDEAVEAFARHDWAMEAAFEHELRSSEADHCPPGIGFAAEGGPLLHICPGAEHAWFTITSSNE